MKIFNRIVSLLMVMLMLISTVSSVTAAEDKNRTEVYTFTVENTFTDSSLAENSAPGVMRFFRRTGFDGCYGNQLSYLARELYDSLVKNYVTEKKTGEYTHTFEAPFIFNADISGEFIHENDELTEIKTELDCAVQTAMDAFLYDHPEIFWFGSMRSSYLMTVTGNDIGGYVGCIDAMDILPNEIYSGAAAKLSQYENAVDAAVAFLGVTDNRYETLKNIHDFICDNAWYNLVSGSRVHSSEAFFVGDGGIVCEGYAKSFKVLCDRTGIPCVLVSGYAGGAHMWNYVQMEDGKWYLVDVTWDDQDSGIYDTYFLVGTDSIGFGNETISQERTERNDFSGRGIFSFTYPVLSSSKYGTHVHEWNTEYTVDTEPTCTENGSKSIHCRTCDETKNVTAIAALGHSWDSGTVSLVSSCKTNGIKTYVCMNDASHQYTEQLELDADSHEGGTYIKGKTEATCTSVGYTGDTFCSGCDIKLSDGQILPLTSHTFTVYSSDGNATCFNDGTKTAICDVCGKATDTVTDENSKNNARHKYSLRSGIDATCTQDGEKTYVCDVCETAAYMEIIPATGHKGGRASCKASAICAECGEKYGLPDVNNHQAVVILRAVSSTCTRTGLTEGRRCSDCGKIITAQKTVAKKPHTNETVVTKATLSKDGKTEIKCSVCGYVSKTTIIPRIKKVVLSDVTYTYNEKNRTPSVTVKDSKGKTLKSGTDYTVTYPKKRKSIGKYTVTVTFKGNYSGSKKLTFEIVPSKASLFKLTAGSKQLTASWKKVSGVTGYEVQCSTSKKFTKKTTKTVTVKKAKSKKTTVKNLKKGKRYYVRVRAYKTVSGKKIYGAWSTVKSIKVN